MIHALATKIIDVFDRNKVMEHDREIYQHGLELMLSYLVGFVVQAIFCIYFNFMIEGAMFIFFFELIRKYSGGYHANSYLGCNITYLFVFVIYFLLLRYSEVNVIAMAALVGVSTIIIAYYAPLEHVHNPLTDEQRIVYRHRCWWLLLIYCGLIAILWRISLYYFYALSIIVILTALMVIAGRFWNLKEG